MASCIEEVSGERVIRLDEEHDLAATCETTFVEPAFAFLCMRRDREGDQQRAELNGMFE